MNKLEDYVHHAQFCGGFGADSLGGQPWWATEGKWRDCTCGLADLMRSIHPEKIKE